MTTPTTDLSGKISIATAVYQTNQELIQFVESKTNFLLVVHGLVLTVLASSIDRLRALVLVDGGTAGAPFLPLALLVFAVSCVASLLAALSVIFARGSIDSRSGRARSFYRHVAHRRSAADYADQIARTGDDECLRDLLEQNHALARVAEAKFDRFRVAFGLELLMLGSFFAVVVALFLKG
jgi:hypothetical protein